MNNQETKDQLAETRESGLDAPERAGDEASQTWSQHVADVHEERRTASGAGGCSNLRTPSLAPSPTACSPTLDPPAIVKVVLCICTCKRPTGLARVLKAVAELEFEGQLSVVVLDNDATAAEGAKFCYSAAPTYRWPLVCAVEERRGIPFARNRAVALALEHDPDFIAMLDDDERPCRGWLRELLRVQAETGADAVGGPVIPEFAPDTPAWLIEGGFFERASHPDKSKVSLKSVGNFMAKASCFRALMPEPFDTRFALTGGEGGIFFRYLAARNYTMHWAVDAHIFETVPASRANLRWLMQRRFRMGVNSISGQRMLEPGAGRELRHVIITIKVLALGSMYFIMNWRRRIRRMEAMLTICRALGRVAGHLGVRYSEYRRIHGA